MWMGPEQLVRSRALNLGSDPLALNKITIRNEKNGVIRREQASGRIADPEDSFNESASYRGKCSFTLSTY